MRTTSLSRLHDHTQTHTHTHTHTHTRYDSSGRMISPSQRPLPDNTQHSYQKDIHAHGGILTHNPSRHAAADPHLTPRVHRDRFIFNITFSNMHGVHSSHHPSCFQTTMLHTFLISAIRAHHARFIVPDLTIKLTDTPLAFSIILTWYVTVTPAA